MQANAGRHAGKHPVRSPAFPPARERNGSRWRRNCQDYGAARPAGEAILILPSPADPLISA